MINNRQSGRRRGRGGGGNGGNGQRQGNPGRPDNGNRIDNRARGNANQLLEKYKNLAAEAQRQGDRVNTEYYLQFADHYFRVLNESRSRFEDQNQPRRQRDDAFDGDFDGDEEYGDEGEPIRGGEQSDPRGGDDQPRGDNRRERAERTERAPRDNRRDGERQPAQQVADSDEPPLRVPVANDDGASAGDAEGEAEPRRRGRPRRARPAADEADAAPAGMDADRLPPSLTPVADEPRADEEKPRRRRLRTANGSEAAAVTLD